MSLASLVLPLSTPQFCKFFFRCIAYTFTHSRFRVFHPLVPCVHPLLTPPTACSSALRQPPSSGPTAPVCRRCPNCVSSFFFCCFTLLMPVSEHVVPSPHATSRPSCCVPISTPRRRLPAALTPQPQGGTQREAGMQGTGTENYRDACRRKRRGSGVGCRHAGVAPWGTT